MRLGRLEQGSFAAALDELMKHFPHDCAVTKSSAGQPRRKRRVLSPARINQLLLDRLSN